jgi:hypothetical protein
MFLRALRVCSPEFFDEEIAKIYEIGKSLQYPKRFLEFSFVQAKRTFYNHVPKAKPKIINSLVVPYASGLEKLSLIFKKLNINLVFTNSTIKSNLIKNSPDTAGCVYSIPCNDCDSVYLGQTGKSLQLRLSQHAYSIRTAQTSNALYLHTSLCDHNINWNGAKSITNCGDFVERNLIESALISQCPNLLNVSTGMYKLDPFLSYNIAQQFKKQL